MKTVRYAGFFVVALCACALAQTNVVEPVTPPLTVNVDVWDLVIGVICPVLIWGLTKVAPKIPKPLLPAITPAVGVGLGLLINWMAGQNLTWFESAKAGAMAVFVREMVNQWVTKRTVELEATPPATPPATPS